MGELIMKEKIKQQNGHRDSTTEKSKAGINIGLSDEGGCDAYASCGGNCHYASASAAAGPALANGYIEMWAGFPGNSTYKYVVYHSGDPAISGSVSKQGSGGCVAGAIGHVDGYCHRSDSSSC